MDLLGGREVGRELLLDRKRHGDEVNVNNPPGPEREISTEVDGVVFFGQMSIQERMVTVTTGLRSKSSRRGRHKAETVARRLLAEIIREEAKILRE